MKHTFNVKTCNGISQVEFDTEKLGPLEKRLLENMDTRAKELVYLFLREGVFEAKGIATEEELLKYEAYRNTVDGKVISECSGIGENGIIINKEQLLKLYYSIWESYLFMESTDMEFMEINFYRSLKAKIDDPDELLFWTFRLCVWGGALNRLPYTLYKGLIDGRFEKFYDTYPTEKLYFVNAED
jgi:hypothetical protein